jgi:hypothetical protein
MKLYIVVYTHRHGSDAWPRFVPTGERKPTVKEEVDQLEDFEPDRCESLEIFGPFEVPAK